ncbi:MAG TPA: HlyD family efflux transporter periplasmic adaptor subunit [Chloroflexota bacterium]|nr:HlyD family efflux transporter periplasmic adaptor subunit [Chloroflexota bacterium]
MTQQIIAVQLEKYTLRAPRDGVILRRSAEPGEVAVVGAPLLVLADLSKPELTVYVP